MISFNNKKLNQISIYVIPVITFSFFLGVYLFARTFMGIYILGFRLGELAILFSLLALIISIMFWNKFKYIELFKNTRLRLILILLIISFILNVILSGSSLFNPYTFKSSSYIWSMGFLFFGLFYSYYFKINQGIIRLFIFLNFYLYYFSFFGVNDEFQKQLLNISDKFEYHKGSDVFLLLTTSLFLMNRFEKKKRFALEVLLLTYSFFSPLLLYKSRGAFIGFTLFFLLELINLKKSFKKPILRNISILFLMTILFFQSLSLVTKSGLVEVDEVRENVEFISSYRALPSSEIFEQKLLYFYEGKIYSSDGNLNWRLQIWQDVVFDLISKNKYLTGYGYNSIIPAMDDPFRAGDDGTNENVHNFFINIFARGGLIHLLLFTLFFIQIYIYSSRFKDIKIMNFLLPVFLVSFFDSSMENSHFPLIVYFIIGSLMQLNKNIQNKDEVS